MNKVLFVLMTIFVSLISHGISHAGPYYEVVNSTVVGTSTISVSGYIGVAASSTTPTTYKIRLDGPGGYVQYPDGTKQTTAYSSSTASGYAVRNDTQTFTGANTFQSSVSISSTDGLVISTFSRTSNGFTWLPGGILVQWGSESNTVSHGSNVTIEFPKSFPTSVLQVVAYVGNTADTATTVTYCPLVSQSANSFVCQYGAINGNSYAVVMRYIAIGY